MYLYIYHICVFVSSPDADEKDLVCCAQSILTRWFTVVEVAEFTDKWPKRSLHWAERYVYYHLSFIDLY